MIGKKFGLVYRVTAQFRTSYQNGHNHVSSEMRMRIRALDAQQQF